MNRKLLQLTSMEFRDVASRMLQPNYTDADVNLHRFMEYIKKNEYISMKLDEYFNGVEYEFKDCFQFEGGGWSAIVPPNSEVKHVKAIYDYINYIIERGLKLEGHSLMYPCSSTKFIDKIRNLTSKFRLLVDIINGFIAKDLVLIDDETKNIRIEQNIQNNYGAANVAIRDIQSSNTYSINDNQELANSLKILVELIKSEIIIPENEKEEIIDDIDIAIEQLESTSPKMSRLKIVSKRILHFLGLNTFNLPSIISFLEQNSDKIDKIKEFMHVG